LMAAEAEHALFWLMRRATRWRAWKALARR